MILVVSHRGQYRSQSTWIGLEPDGSKPHEFRLSRQVGQESNLQPAVLEHAAPHSSPSHPVSPVVRGQNSSHFSSQAVWARLSLLLSKVLSTPSPISHCLVLQSNDTARRCKEQADVGPLHKLLVRPLGPPPSNCITMAVLGRRRRSAFMLPVVAILRWFGGWRCMRAWDDDRRRRAYRCGPIRIAHPDRSLTSYGLHSGAHLSNQGIARDGGKRPRGRASHQE